MPFIFAPIWITKLILMITTNNSSSLIQEKSVNALLVIDIQENLLNPASVIHIDTTNIELFLSNLNHVIKEFEMKKNHIFYIINEWSNPIWNFFTKNVCKKGGKGVGIDNRLNVVNDNIFSKSKANSLSNKSLLANLKANNITNVYVMGLQAEYCVKATVNGLLKEKFNVVVVKDALGSVNTTKYNKTINYFERKDIKLIETKNIKDSLICN